MMATLLGLLAAGPAQAADPDSPHPHRGIVEPFVGAPPSAALSAAQLRTLAGGEAVLATVEGDQGGRAIAVQDVEASPETVWDRITAFRQYPEMVNYVAECEPYREDGSDLRVRFVLKILTFRYEYYIRHDYQPEEGYMSWTLDYTRESDLDDSVGYWAVVPHPESPDRSRVFYSIDMRTRGWMPAFLRRMIARQGLVDATGWVKREAEALQRSKNEALTRKASVEVD
jgi:hypothetical protein